MRGKMLATLALAGLAATSGCGEGTPLVPVDGLVTLDGKPVSGMIVSFAPEGETQGNGALGYVGEDGRFSLTDARGEPGVRVGQYRVSFYPALKNNLPEDDPSGVVAPPGKSTVPGIYLQPYTSPVLATVPEGGAEIQVLLTPDGKGAEAKSGPRSK
jgi:hypothetical protein